MRIMNIIDLLIFSADAALIHQREDGSFPSGHNGPYKHPETPVRNTAHFLFLLASLYEKTGYKRYKLAGELAASYLLSSKVRPFGKTFFCRRKEKKDACNGLIGQAWVIESLIKAYEVFNYQEYYNLAEKLFCLHPWNKTIGLWQRVEIDGTLLSYDTTFNHQLWFAATASLLVKTPEAQQSARVYLDKVVRRVSLYPNGVIFHLSPLGELSAYLREGPKLFFHEIASRFEKIFTKRNLYLKSVGYHGFNLYALSILKEVFPNANIWRSKKLKQIISAHRALSFAEALAHSKYGYHYNLTGIEVAYALEQFGDNSNEPVRWLNSQIDKTYLDETCFTCRDVPDLNTSRARIYQAARLRNNYEITLG